MEINNCYCKEKFFATDKMLSIHNDMLQNHYVNVVYEILLSGICFSFVQRVYDTVQFVAIAK